MSNLPSESAPVHRQKLHVVDELITSLHPYKRNARTHSKVQIRKIAESIRSFGFTNPVLIDKENTIIAGHGRVEAAKLLGLAGVPTIRLENLTPAQVRAYVIADNRIAAEAGWDNDILKIELQHLVIENEIDISLTGFETAEIDLILSPVQPEADPEDEFPEDISEVRTRPGDLWSLGEHRILCGDAREDSCFASLMDDKRAAIVFADPPYNVAIDGHASGNGRVHHNEFAMASGEMNEAEFVKFLRGFPLSTGRLEYERLRPLPLYGLAPYARTPGCREISL